MTGRIGGLSGGVPAFQEFGGITGFTSSTTVEADVETLSPNRALSVQNLAVRLSAAPGSGNARTFFVHRDEFFAGLGCTIFDAAQTCNSGGVVDSIPAGSTLAIVIFNFDGGTPGDLPAASATFGFELR